MCCCNNKCNVGCGWNCGCNCGCVSWGNNNNNNNNNNSWCCRPNDWASCQFRRGYAAGFNAGYETGFRDGFWAGNNNNVMPITAPCTANESGCGCNCH